MKKLAMLFPGQGTQYVGMGKQLYENYQIARDTFEEASEALGIDLKKICFDGSLETLTKTEITQPAILTVSVASYRIAMKEYSLQPSYFVGHSMGEITALCCAEGISLVDAVKIANARGRFMQEAVPEGKGSMSAVIGIAVDEVEKLCSEYNKNSKEITIANYNSPKQIVISGYTEAVAAAGEELKNKGAIITPLKVSAPFHSWLMQPAADLLRAELNKYKFSALKYPVISNCFIDIYQNEDSIIDNLTAQLINPIKWTDIMSFLKEKGTQTMIDVGPKMVLKNLAKKNVDHIEAYSLDISTDVDKLYMHYKNSECNVEDDCDYNHVIAKCIAIAVCTKNQNWDEEDYHNNMVVPYQNIVKMKNELDEMNMIATKEQAIKALNMLELVFLTKKTSADEQKSRFKQLFKETNSDHVFYDYAKKYL